MKDNSQPPGPRPEGTNFDRAGFLKNLRNELLIKLGLPPGAKPEKVLLLMKIKEEMAKIKPEK